MACFYEWDSTVSRLQSCCEETVILDEWTSYRGGQISRFDCIWKVKIVTQKLKMVQ